MILTIFAYAFFATMAFALVAFFMEDVVLPLIEDIVEDAEKTGYPKSIAKHVAIYAVFCAICGLVIMNWPNPLSW